MPVLKRHAAATPPRVCCQATEAPRSMARGFCLDGLAALLESEQVIAPVPVGLSLKVLASAGAHAHMNPSHNPVFLGVETVGFTLNESDNIGDGIAPPPGAIRLRPTNMSDVLMGAVAVRLVNAINTIVCHSGDLSQKYDLPEASGH
jgi:hypothetical protein